ncbi:hypothetical protein AB1Y20_008368 [Prymnesium parvum]|uniref:Uncharacterized protein n=1 Tax=Prymnesium parvum TaxID=97485 RepID=A0AB34ITD4_PRYPA
MAAREEDNPSELRLLRSPHHEDRRTLVELAAIESVDALHVACVQNQRCLVQTSEGVYLLARRADVVDDVLGVWLSASGEDEPEEVVEEEFFQALPFHGGRATSPRLIILGLLHGKFTHTHTGRDYWVTEVEANDYGVRAVVLSPSPAGGAISRARAVRRTVDEFISAFLTPDPAPARSPARQPRQTTSDGAMTPVPQLATTVASLDVSQRPIGKALRLWPRWQQVAPSLANPAAAAVDDLAELLGPLMGRAVQGRMAVISALAKVDGQLSFERRRKASLRTAVRDLGDEDLTVADVGTLFRDHLCPGGTPAGTPRRSAARQAREPRSAEAQGEDLLGRLGSGDEGDATDSGDSEGEEPEARPTRRNATPTRAAQRHADTEDEDGSHEPPARRQRGGRQVVFPAAELSQLTPPGVAPLAVARLFFKVRELAEAPSFVLPDDLDEPSERSAYEERAGRAFQRLREMCDDHWPSEHERPRDLSEVRQLRERILDVVCAQGARARGQAARSGDNHISQDKSKSTNSAHAPDPELRGIKGN